MKEKVGLAWISFLALHCLPFPLCLQYDHFFILTENQLVGEHVKEQHKINKSGFWLTILATSCLVFLSKTTVFTWLVGTHSASMNWASVTAPVLGLQAGLWTALLFCLDGKWLGLKSLLVLIHALHLPTLVSAWAYRGFSLAFYVLLPMVAILMFVVHPIGSQAYWYAFFWFIPITCFFLPVKSRFTRALGTTFIAHAVGSLVWLYGHELPKEVWMSLPPVVLLERLTIAVGIVALDYGWDCLKVNLPTRLWRPLFTKRGQVV